MHIKNYFYFLKQLFELFKFVQLVKVEFFNGFVQKNIIVSNKIFFFTNVWLNLFLRFSEVLVSQIKYVLFQKLLPVVYFTIVTLRDHLQRGRQWEKYIPSSIQIIKKITFIQLLNHLLLHLFSTKVYILNTAATQYKVCS